MSLRKKIPEIARLKQAFEKEAQEFHDLQFSQMILTQDRADEIRKFSGSNHCIMLWQFYGNLDDAGSTTRFVKSLEESELKWGIRGAKLSAFGVLEGEKVDLFVRMAKRAGSLFSDKESRLIKSRVVNELVEKSTEGKPTSVVNDNPLAIWLNYLLYHISKVNPERSKSAVIDPDPFSLSLLALERLEVEPSVGKIDRSTSRIEELQFSVALSFPGERRSYISKVADCLRKNLGKDKLFYDFDYQSQLARPNLDVLLQTIYKDNSDLVVVVLCAEYAQKKWCGLEWRAIREIIKSKENERIMFMRFDDAEIDGVFSIDGYIDLNKYTPKVAAQFILERVKSIGDGRA